MPKSQDKAMLFLNYWRMLAPGRVQEQVIWQAEYNFDRSLGRHHRFDWADLYRQVAVEVDGGQFIRNGGRHNTDDDREKLNIAAAMGWRVYRFSTQQLERDPQKCIDWVVLGLGIKP